jgi:hypothetical protein
MHCALLEVLAVFVVLLADNGAPEEATCVPCAAMSEVGHPTISARATILLTAKVFLTNDMFFISLSLPVSL